MQRYEPAERVSVPVPTQLQLWVIAVLAFGVGDIVTTTIGLRTAGVVEQHPVAAFSFQYGPVPVMVVLKTVVFVGCYLLWRAVSRPYCLGVPLGLAVLGVLVTTWNLSILAVALLL